MQRLGNEGEAAARSIRKRQICGRRFLITDTGTICDLLESDSGSRNA